MCNSYSVSRRTRRWPLAIFVALLNVAGINVLYNFNNMESQKIKRVFLKNLALSLMTPHLKERTKIVSHPPRVKSIMSKYAAIEETEGDRPIKIRARCVLCPKAILINTTIIVCSKCHAHSCKAHVQTTHVCNKCTEYGNG